MATALFYSIQCTLSIWRVFHTTRDKEGATDSDSTQLSRLALILLLLLPHHGEVLVHHHRHRHEVEIGEAKGKQAWLVKSSLRRLASNRCVWCGRSTGRKRERTVSTEYEREAGVTVLNTRERNTRTDPEKERHLPHQASGGGSYGTHHIVTRDTTLTGT